MVDVLEKRVRQLESRVYDPTKKDGDIECIPFLSKLNADLGNNLDRRDRIAPIMRRIQELELYLDPNFSEDKGIPTGVKLELILAQEQKIRETSDMLAKVEALKPSLNTEKLQHVAEAQSKIVSMSKIQVEQEEEARNMTEQTLSLVQQYNDIIDTITSTFLYYDKVLSAAEKKLESQKQRRND